MRTYYDILGVSKDAKPTEIVEAYERRDIKTAKLKEAYDILSDPKSKEKYDQELEEKRCKNYYEILGVSKDASLEDIVNTYNNLAEAKKDEEATRRAYETLRNPRKRAKYNIKIGNISLKKEARLKLKEDVDAVLANPSNEHDSYVREIYIKRYENKIALLEQQIELIQNEKDRDRFSYRVRLSKLITQLDIARKELERWKTGRKEVAYTEEIKRGKKTIEVERKGKGTEGGFVSHILNTSIEHVNNNNTQIQSSSNNFFQKTGYRLLNVFWKTIKGLSAGSIKLYSNSWSTIVQGFVINRTNILEGARAVFSSEEEFEELVENAITR